MQSPNVFSCLSEKCGDILRPKGAKRYQPGASPQVSGFIYELSPEGATRSVFANNLFAPSGLSRVFGFIPGAMPQAGIYLRRWRATTILISFCIFFSFSCFAEDVGFYDGDGASCSLGCACGWKVIVPKNVKKLGKDTPQKENSDLVTFSKCLLIQPGDSIKFQMEKVAPKGVNFDGFCILGGSWNGKQDCTFPKEVEILVNGKSLGKKILDRTHDNSFLLGDKSSNVFTGDILEFKVLSGYRSKKRIGITMLSPNGAH
jgi:hypothetical protein